MVHETHKGSCTHRCLTMSMSLVTELARSETEELASVRRLLSSGVWPFGLLLVLFPMDLQEEMHSQFSQKDDFGVELVNGNDDL